MVQRVCDTYGVLFRKTPIAHSHQQNAKVENANRQVLRSLRAFILDERAMDNWTRALPAVQFIFNTTIHRDIGYSSADLLFGPAVNMSRFILEKKEINDPTESIVWWDQQQEIHADILKKAADLQREVDEKRITIRTKLPTSYKVDSYVLVEYPLTMGDGRGRPLNKLQTILKGPMKVLEVKDDAYDLLDLVSRRVETVHVARLHPFIYDPTTVDPDIVAIRDQGEFIVQEIVDALIDQNLPKTEWSFKVRWSGYDESFDEWLDWNEIKNVDKLHDYFRSQNLGRHIPKSQQKLEDKPLKRKQANIKIIRVDEPKRKRARKRP